MAICYKYNWQIGVYNFNIYTQNQKLEMPFHNLNLAKHKKRIPINIWLNENEKDKEKIISFCKEKAMAYIPEELDLFYKNINQILR